MLILALDTTSEWGGAGVFGGERALALAPNDGPANRYSVTLFELTDRALAQAGVALSAIDLFAVVNGPGSFTGIRVGLAAAQGWGAAFGKPAVGVSAFEAMVEAARPKAERAFAILDARREEFFLGELRRRPPARPEEGDAFTFCGEGRVLAAAALEKFFKECITAGEAPFACIVREPDLKAAALRAKLPERVEWLSVNALLLASVAKIARRRRQAGETPQAPDACYVRRAEAEILWRG